MPKETLPEIHDLLAKDLLKRIKSGEATTADLNCARQFLKDNGISNIPEPSNNLGQLITSLPFPGNPLLKDELQ